MPVITSEAPWLLSGVLMLSRSSTSKGCTMQHSLRATSVLATRAASGDPYTCCLAPCAPLQWAFKLLDEPSMAAEDFSFFTRTVGL